MSVESTTHDQVELVRALVGALDRCDVDTVVSFHAPDAVFEAAVGRFEGVAAISGFLDDWLANYEGFEATLEEVRDLGDGVTFGVIRQQGRLVGSSGHVQLRHAAVFVWVDGVIARAITGPDIDKIRAIADRLAEERGKAVSENLALVRSIFMGWEQGNFGSSDWADSDIDYLAADGPDLAGGKGLVATAAIWRKVLGAWRDLRIHAEAYRELDHARVLVLVQFSARGRASGLQVGEMRANGAALFELRDGHAPNLARWLQEGTHRIIEWETDLSSQTGASQAGILLGSNEDIPAFRWVEKETGRLMTCSAPADCAEIEARHANGSGLLVDGGASRGNLLSGEADEVILTVSRMDAEKRANPGYRPFLANGFNVTRALVLFGWEVMLELFAATRQRRRDIRPRGYRGGYYPLLRAALCVVVRDLIVFGVLTDMMSGRPAVYATFSSYDEVAHHSGLERSDTMEALYALDEHFGRISRARRYAPRPYKLVVLSDHGQTQGATFKQRNGYGLDELVERSLETGSVARLTGGDENDAAVGQALSEATGRTASDGKGSKDDVSGREVVVLGSGNLGLVYLMDEPRRLTLEEIEQRHPRLLGALREHPHIGFLLVHSAEHGPVVLGARGTSYLATGRVDGEDPLAGFSSTASAHLERTDRFEHVADIMVNSFYDPQLDEGCAFEELISFHGGMGGPQTRPFLIYPDELPAPEEPIIGAASVHEILAGWRHSLQDEHTPAPTARG